ncbi:MAG: SEC-C domain-containing protein [Chloroflexi bacterium]|nr:SEC-C domain-containing protein [Chloroflexota bacterium]MBU1750144.1 SEC-C domain-containing protein [Chloroflexota bacterium]
MDTKNQDVQLSSPCPCGSGRKYGECCGTPAAFHVDFLDRRIEVFTEAILVNTLRRENERKAALFDEQYKEELDAMSAEFARIVSALWAGIKNLDENKAANTGQAAAASLLQYALKTTEAATDLLRRGYRHQVGMLMRNASEAIATVISIASNPETLDKVKTGKFKSPDAISEAKKIIPFFGRWYGELSSMFTHLNIDHFEWEPLLSQDDVLVTQTCILFIKTNLVLTSVATELIFYDYVATPRFWKEIEPDAYMYAPDEDTWEWMKAFFGEGYCELR